MHQYAVAMPNGWKKVVTSYRDGEFTKAVVFCRIYFKNEDRRIIGDWHVADFFIDGGLAEAEAQRVKTQRHFGNYSVDVAVVEAWPVRDMDRPNQENN